MNYWLLVVKRGMVNGKSFPDVRDPKDAAVGSGLGFLSKKAAAFRVT